MEIKERIKIVLRLVSADHKMVIEDNMTLFDDLKLDSLDFVDFVQSVEQEFNTTLDIQQLEAFRLEQNLKGVTFGQFAEFVDVSLQKNRD